MTRYTLTLLLRAVTACQIGVDMAALLVLITIAGCATPLKPAPADWPELTVVEIVMSDADVRAICSGHGVARSGNACAIVTFGTWTCLIVSSVERPMSARIRQEELDHCAGKDHPGEDSLGRAWEKWKKSQ